MKEIFHDGVITPYGRVVMPYGWVVMPSSAGDDLPA